MTHRATITLDDEAHAFLLATAGKNRSAYINALIKKEQEQTLARRILKANQEEALDALYQAELEAWEVTLSDGLP